MSQTLRHKGYDGSVEYSAEDRILHGSLLGIRDMVTYEGSDVDSLEANFKAATDEYLALCEVEGKTPDQPFKGSFNVRVGADLHKRAALFAEDHHQKLNNVISQALETFLAVEDAHR
ncbi:type II toxin-antitoxin system HicB family antitoxin [Terracidiphilus gabretensis]|jgi:predicted HicB family RNase H-like nuclease|uniref:type II toxin-antitoxin system HicB family antitoxin n=1 Tax=Terracidiphilus gabretensis TaxID=1577687 RepID=UPI00071C192E|nr:type II toxin-antitoxin system HicB family antitoxin [Terracidiphilus gabretensis]